MVAVAIVGLGLPAGGQEGATGTQRKSLAALEAASLDPFDRPDGSIVDQTARFYVWFDKQGWHVRTTAKGARNFTGSIRLKDAKIKSCVPIGLTDGRQKGKVDAVKFNDARNDLRFSFKTGTLSDGFDLAVEGDKGQIEFDLSIDGKRNAKTVFIGSGKRHPSKTPFSLPATPERAK